MVVPSCGANILTANCISTHAWNVGAPTPNVHRRQVPSPGNRRPGHSRPVPFLLLQAGLEMVSSLQITKGTIWINRHVTSSNDHGQIVGCIYWGHIILSLAAVQIYVPAPCASAYITVGDTGLLCIFSRRYDSGVPRRSFVFCMFSLPHRGF